MNQYLKAALWIVGIGAVVIFVVPMIVVGLVGAEFLHMTTTIATHN